MKIKIFALIIAMIIISIFMISCSESEQESMNSSDTTDNTESNEFEERIKEDTLLSRFKDVDYNEYEFRVLCMDSGNNQTTRFLQEIYVDEADGDIINDAVYHRNMIVENTINIKIVPVTASEGDIVAKARASISAGDNEFDITSIYKFTFPPLIQEGYLRDWFEIPEWDHTQPWWNDKCYNDMKLKGRLYGMSGSFLISDIDDTLAMIFNKSLADDYNTGDLYEIINNKKWTIDKMTEIVKNITHDINGDGQYNVTDDLFGYVQDPISMTNNWVFSSNITTGNVDSENKYIVDVNVEKVQTLLEKMYELFGVGDHALTNVDLFQGLTYFENNRIFLYAIILRNVEALRAMEIDFGIIPYPLFDESQSEYLTHVGVGSPVIQIPITNVGNDELLGTVLEALAETSHEFVLPAYYEMALKTKISRDEESSEMLDIILQGRVYDITYYVNYSIAGGVVGVINKLILNKNTDFSSQLDRNIESIQSKFQDYLDGIN